MLPLRKMPCRLRISWCLGCSLRPSIFNHSSTHEPELTILRHPFAEGRETTCRLAPQQESAASGSCCASCWDLPSCLPRPLKSPAKESSGAAAVRTHCPLGSLGSKSEIDTYMWCRLLLLALLAKEIPELNACVAGCAWKACLSTRFHVLGDRKLGHLAGLRHAPRHLHLEHHSALDVGWQLDLCVSSVAARR